MDVITLDVINLDRNSFSQLCVSVCIPCTPLMYIIYMPVCMRIYTSL
jgi:hypothetical protein